MTYSNLFKLKLKQFWPMAVCSGIFFFLLGPFVMIVRLSRFRQMEYYRLQSVVGTLDTTVIFYNCAAIILALIFGIMTFRYLHQKKELDFYHAQPIHRTKLFFSNYLAGLAMLYVPMIAMYLLEFVLIAVYGYGDIIATVPMIANLAYMILFSLASYSLAVFAGQLTGTTATHGAMAALLSFIVPITAVLWELAAQLFRATAHYGYEGDLVNGALRFSPLAAMLRNHYQAQSMYPVPFGKVKMALVLPETFTMLIQIVSIILFTVIAWKLYQKRKSEVCGSAMVYGFTEPILKGYVMFLAAFGAACIVFSVSSAAFFYLTFFLFAILAHMVCEVILRKDFKAMLGNKKMCGILLIVLLALLMCLRFDVTGFDRYVPKEADVEDMHITAFAGWYQYGSGSYNDNKPGITDPQTKHLAMNLVHAIVDNRYYQKSRFEGNDIVDGDHYYSNVLVAYHLKNGKTVYRNYRNVPLHFVYDAYRDMMNDKGFAEYAYRDIMQINPETLVTMEIRSLSDGKYSVVFDSNLSPEDVFYSEKQTAMVPSTTEVDAYVGETILYPERFELSKNILNAYRLDLMDRTGDILLEEANQSPEYELLMWFDKWKNTGITDTVYFCVPVYACDTRTIALLEEIR